MLTLVTESWTWYAITWLVVVARVISRKMLVGSFKKLQVDDFLMLIAMICDTVLMISMNIVADTSSNLIDPNDKTVMDAANIKSREYGSKMVLVVEQMQCCVIWLVKACLLLVYVRLTMNLKQRIAVKFVAIYAGLGFIVMEVLYFAVWCRPFNEYWAVPTDNVQCSAATHHLITNLILNVTSDIMIMAIPMPILLKSSLPKKQKIILSGVFLLGSFTMLSALLSKYYSFTEPFGSSWTFWYIRESSTALITANLPGTWTLIRQTFGLTSLHGRSTVRTGANSSGFRPGYPSVRHASRIHSRSAIRGDDIDTLELGATDSQEQINKSYLMPLQIYKQQQVQVEVQEKTKENADRESHGGGRVKPTPPPKIAFLERNSAQGDVEVHEGGVVTTCEGAPHAERGVA